MAKLTHSCSVITLFFYAAVVVFYLFFTIPSFVWVLGKQVELVEVQFVVTKGLVINASENTLFVLFSTEERPKMPWW